MFQKLEVIHVDGRYPARPRVLKPENMEAEVVEREPGVFVVRIDDKANDEMWLQVTLRVGKEAVQA